MEERRSVPSKNKGEKYDKWYIIFTIITIIHILFSIMKSASMKLKFNLTELNQPNLMR